MLSTLEAAVKEWREASKLLASFTTYHGKSAGIQFTQAMRRYTEAEERLAELADELQ